MVAKSSHSDIVLLAPEALRNTPLRNGYRYWDSLRAGRLWPAREELNPRHMTELLGYMTLVKVIGGGADFEYRIVGDVMVQAYAVSIQHRTFSNIAQDVPDAMDLSFRLFRQVLRDGKPLAWHQHSGQDTTSVIFTDSEMVLLPLGREDIDHVLGFGIHQASAGTLPPARTPGLYGRLSRPA